MAGALILRGGQVADGLSDTPCDADVRVDGELITAVGPGLPDDPAGQTLDITGHTITPGFIDAHSHDDLAIVKPSFMEPKIRQGVTTTVVGNCGHGCAPYAGPAMESYSGPVLGDFPADARWNSFPDYLAALAAEPRRVNVAALVPHGPLRWAVLGSTAGAASDRDVADICALADEGLAAGAAGVSLGLMYSPGNAASTDELCALARVVAKRGKLLVAHLRNEARHLPDSINEFLELGRSAGCALHISHLKVTGPRNHGSMPQIIDRLDAARTHGLDVTADVYPYTAGSTTVATLFPQWALADGLADTLRDPAARARIRSDLRADWGDLENYYASLGPDAIRLVGFSSREHTGLEGRSLSEAAAALGVPPDDCLMDVTAAEGGRLTVILFQTDEHDMRAALRWPWTMIGSDGLPTDGVRTHPRLYGTFIRILSRYASTLGFGEAVQKMTSRTAARFGLAGRGVVAAGQAADLVVIDRGNARERASYDDPRQFPSGVAEVIVNGQRALGRQTHASGALQRIDASRGFAGR